MKTNTLTRVFTAIEKAPIAALATKRFEAKGQNCSQWESDINSLASPLYGL